MIVSTLILVFSVGSLAQFSLAYCRTLLIAYGKVEISDRAREIAAIHTQSVQPEMFSHLNCLLRLVPEPGDDSAEIGIVNAYFAAMSLLRGLFGPVSARVSQWFEGELSMCAHFAAVTLDRRLHPLAHN
ncbi:MAG: hypothetical protein ACRD59_01065 [Candidatus Acidiferrales bacterium]